MSRLTRRRSLALIAGGALPLAAPSILPARAAKPIEFIVPSAPGGGTDIIARIVAQSASETLGEQIIILNRPGAAQLVGTEYVARAPKDGRTILVGGSAALSLQPMLRKTLSYKPSDFASVAVLLDGPMALTINSAYGATDLAGFVAEAKRRGKSLRYSTNGPGTLTHLFGMMLGEAVGVPVVDVPYRGNGPSTTDLLAVHIEFGLESPATTIGHVQEGKLRILALTFPERAPLLPDVPTFRELGYPQLTATYWIALLAPAGSPRPMIEKLNAAANKALSQPEVQDRLAREGLRPGAGGPEELDRRIADDTRIFGELIRSRNIALD